MSMICLTRLLKVILYNYLKIEIKYIFIDNQLSTYQQFNIVSY